MTVEYVCPVCGGHVIVEFLLAYPPVMRYRCLKCGYRHDEKEETKKIIAPLPDDRDKITWKGQKLVGTPKVQPDGKG